MTSSAPPPPRRQKRNFPVGVSDPAAPPPPASTLAMKMVQLASRPDVTLAELGAVAGADPGFALRLLSVVNSPAYGFARKVNDTGRAIAMIGIRSLRNLALSLVLTDMVPMGEDGEALLAISIRRAAAARLAIALLDPQIDVNEYFTAGLFLECGLLLWAREDLAIAGKIARVPANERPLRERLAGRPEHPRAGADMAGHYALTEITAQAIAHHHDKTKPDGPLLVQVCWLAEKLSAVFEGGDLTQLEAEAIKAGASMGLDARGVRTLLRQIPSTTRRIASSFDRSVGRQKGLDELLVDAHRGALELNQKYDDLVRELEALLAEKEGLLREKEALTQELTRANIKLERLASTDPLTGIANHRAFRLFLQRELARSERKNTPLSVVLMDVDKFKDFNDTYGHKCGDEVLKTVGRALKHVARKYDLVARYGGEEFVLVFPDTTQEQALIGAEKARRTIETMRVAGPTGPLQVTASFGVATVCGPGASTQFDAIVEASDQAMYRAKESGRNQVCGASPPSAKG